MGSISRIVKRVLVGIFCILCPIILLVGFEEEYQHIPEENIQDLLYKATAPDMLNRTHIDCKYDEILTRKTEEKNLEVTKILNNFSSWGIKDGTYVSKRCNPAFSVAILVTYRNREKQLKVFLPYIHNFLRKQYIHYKIYLIEQRDEKPWNKGLLYNIGAKAAIADKFPCLILHDVDLIPLDERNLYVCTHQPRHMSACVDKFNYKLPYVTLVGGVLAIRSDQFTAVNGFSNRFHDWGGEDDDLAARIMAHGLDIIRFPRSMSQYTMLRHPPERINPDRLRIMEENRHLSGDGLGSIRYTSVNRKQLRLYTWIKVVT